MKRKISGSQAIMECLLKEGVEVVFGYPGGAIMPVYDALYDYQDKIRHVLVRHEQGAAHAAEGYARITGKPAVCLTTSGPGATNLVTGIADAMIDSIPMVCITGQVGSHVLGTDAFQEADVIGITTPITKWCYQVTDAYELPEVIKKAFAIATHGRPGPVVIDVTKSAQTDMFEFDDLKEVDLPRLKNPISIDVTQISEAAKLLNNAKNPFLFIGHGVLISHAEKEILELVEIGDIPVGSTLMGLSAFPSDHKNYVGLLGMHGNYSTNKLTNQADVILAIGLRFDDRVTGKVSEYAKQAKIIHIDIDESELNKIVPVEIAIHADAKVALKTLIPLIRKNHHHKWLSQFKELEKKEYEIVGKHEITPTEGEITMAEVIDQLNYLTKGEAVIVSDVGQNQMIAARYSKFKNTNSYITSGGLGTMGFALPAAIGAKVAGPKKEVIAIIGDGGFQMNIQELGTIAQENLPVKIIILNNNFLGMVRQWQELFFDKRYSFVHLQNPDFIAVAKGFGVEGLEVKNRNELKKSLETLMSHDGPFLLDIKVKKEGNVFPMVPAGASVDEVRLE